MKTSSLIMLVLAVMLAVSLASVWFYPSVQDFMASNTMWNGIQKFSADFKAEQIDSLASHPTSTEKKVLVAIPYLEYSEAELADIRKFVEDGGRLVLMDDFGYGNQILEYLGLEARFDHQILLDPFFCYKNAYLPRISDLATEAGEIGIKVIGLNHATILTGVTEAQITARSSDTSFLDSNENGQKDEGEAEGPFAVAAEVGAGKGTVALASDPSLIINTMVERNDNYRFVQYLTGGQTELRSVLLDRSHLAKSPLDISKIRGNQARNILASPYTLLGLLAVAFVLIGRLTLVKEES